MVTAKSHIDTAFTVGEVIIELESETLVDEVVRQLEKCGFLAIQPTFRPLKCHIDNNSVSQHST